MFKDCTIRSCDFDTEQTCVLHSPEKRTEQISSDTEVHLALTPLQPVVFFGFQRRMSVTVVGTVEGGSAPTKIKTDLKKPIINLVCHPRLPVLYVAYADGLIRAYNIHTYAVHYTLQLDNTIKLLGASAFAFHPTLEWIFVGDRRGTLIAWDVSTERPSMIGITQVGSQPITSISWLPMLRLLVTLSKDGTLQGLCSLCFEGKAFILGFFWNFSRPSASNTTARASFERRVDLVITTVISSATLEKGTEEVSLSHQLISQSGVGFPSSSVILEGVEVIQVHPEGKFHLQQGSSTSSPLAEAPDLGCSDEVQEPVDKGLTSGVVGSYNDTGGSTGFVALEALAAEESSFGPIDPLVPFFINQLPE
ncbi:hypothetical protein HHK36_008429 [Tetracentron sinense]|uniref:Uncharacterized protein n=1 Tax=Tetracentron sinense TaxID=13715 RepID=A0A834ZQ49_TETSI|nr:hypothetical protein HHK36_008429 [Tetracentron sinense]